MRVILLISMLFFVTEGQAHNRFARRLLALPAAEQGKRLLLHGIAAVTLSCMPLSCGLQGQNVPPAAVQQSKAAFFIKKSVHFRIDGRSYRGQVQRLADEEQVVIRTRDNAEKTVNIKDISGVRIETHDLLFKQVRAPVDNGKLRFVQGLVVTVFTDGYAVVSVAQEIDHDYNEYKVRPSYDAFYPIRQLTVLEREDKKTPPIIATR